jgi:hypothetical protein
MAYFIYEFYCNNILIPNQSWDAFHTHFFAAGLVSPSTFSFNGSNGKDYSPSSPF